MPLPCFLRALPGSVWILLAAALLPTLAAAPAAAVPVTFRYQPGGHATTVSVAGTFNEWNVSATPMLDADGDGIWEVLLDLAMGEYQYKFVVNGTDWFTDETAEAFTDDGFGGQNSILRVGDEPMVVGESDAAPLVPSGTPVTFRYRPQGEVNAVSVAGTFNGWNAAAHVLSDPDGDGVWEVTVYCEPGEYAYQFVIDGKRWVGDPSAAKSEDDGFGGRNALVGVGSQPLTVGEGS